MAATSRPPLGSLDANDGHLSSSSTACGPILPFAGWGWSRSCSSYEVVNVANMPPLNSAPGPTPPRPSSFRSDDACGVMAPGMLPSSTTVKNPPARKRSIGSLFRQSFGGGGGGGGGSSSASSSSAAHQAGPSAAPTLGEVHHGITLRGAQLTWAVLMGVKRVENRHFRMKPGWYALHTGVATSSHESQYPLLAAVEGLPRESELPHSCIVGAIEITHSLALEDCADVEPWAFGPVVNVIGSVCRLPRPVPHKGALSVWRIEPDEREEVLAQLPDVQVVANDISHLPTTPAGDVLRRPRTMTGGY